MLSQYARFLLLYPLIIRTMVTTESCPPQMDVYLFNCSGGGLSSTPHHIHPETRTLDLSHNHLNVLHEDSFTVCQRLTQLILDYNEIFKITEKAMSVFVETLRKLSLRGNRLSFRSPMNFSLSALINLQNLRILDLSENPLGLLVSNGFEPLGGTLKVLQLASPLGHLEVQSNAFFGLGRLEELDVSNSSFHQLPENAFMGIRPEKLRRLDLRHIEWNCDCTLLWLRQWLDELTISSAGITGPCVSPRGFRSIPLIDLPLGEFQCPPKLQGLFSSAPHFFGVSRSHMHVTPTDGESITLTCTFVSEPKMLVQWYRNSALLRPELKRFTQTVGRGSKFSTVLSITALQTVTDSGNYTCKTTNNRGSAKGVFHLRVSNGKYLLDEGFSSSTMNAVFQESPQALIASLIVICCCIIGGVGLLLILLIYQLRSRKASNHCQKGFPSLPPPEAPTFENVICFEPASHHESDARSHRSPQVAYRKVKTVLENPYSKPLSQEPCTQGLKCGPFPEVQMPLMMEREKESADTNKPIVRTFAPFISSSDRDDDDDDDDNDDESENDSSDSGGVDEACPVHGSVAKAASNFCPVHSNPLVFNDSGRKWRTLERYTKIESSRQLNRRINSATTDLHLTQ